MHTSEMYNNDDFVNDKNENKHLSQKKNWRNMGGLISIQPFTQKNMSITFTKIVIIILSPQNK
jgi:hypothetical protein